MVISTPLLQPYLCNDLYLGLRSMFDVLVPVSAVFMGPVIELHQHPLFVIIEHATINNH